MSKLILFGEPGWGSVLTEAQLYWYDIPFEFHGVGDLFSDEGARRELEKFNPLGQIPSLVSSKCRVMTESAAITLWLADRSESAGLAAIADATKAVPRLSRVWARNFPEN